MAKELEPKINEEAGTVKIKVQKYLILMFVFVSFAFLWGLINSFSSEDEKVAKKEEPVAKEKEVVVKAEQKEVGNFNDAVKSEMLRLERNNRTKESNEAIQEARQRIADEARPYVPESKSDSPAVESESVSEYEAFKKDVIASGKVRTLVDIENYANTEVKLERTEEDFAVQERKRALEARRGSVTLAPVTITTGGQSRAASVSEHSERPNSINRKLAEIKAKAAEAEALKNKILSGDYSSGDLNSLASDIAQVREHHRPRYSKVRTDEPRIVGAEVSKANEIGINGVKLPTATAIKAVLSQTVMSDYTNKPFKAQITQDVYDADYETILFPKGTIVDGKAVRISNINEPIQARMGLTINWFVLPNGNRVDFSQSAQALDAMGIGGIKDEVNYHALAQFLGVVAYAVVSSETSSDTSSTLTGQTNIGGDIGRGIREQLSPLASRYLSLVPTVTLNTGTPITIYIENEMHVEPWGTIYDKLM